MPFPASYHDDSQSTSYPSHQHIRTASAPNSQTTDDPYIADDDDPSDSDLLPSSWSHVATAGSHALNFMSLNGKYDDYDFGSDYGFSDDDYGFDDYRSGDYYDECRHELQRALSMLSKTDRDEPEEDFRLWSRVWDTLLD